MRLFSAIPFPEESKNKIAELTRGRLPVPYISIENLHITLLFIGELDSDEVSKVVKLFQRSVVVKKPIKIEFDAIVKFHHQLHLTLKNNPELKQLQASMEDFFIVQGFKFQNRDYYPHVRLANVHMDNHMFRKRKVEDFPNQELSQLNFSADKIILYESKLLLHHPNYIPMAEVNLYEN